jgi:dihydropyrimidinase
VSTNPARIMGLAPAKGEIRVGADADLVIFDLEQEITLDEKNLHQHVDYTPFAGMHIQGWPETVLVRGRMTVAGGTLLSARGDGAFVYRQTSTLNGHLP